MAGFNSMVKVKSALPTQKHFHPLSCDHSTTMDYFQLRPVFIRPCIPGETLDVNLSTFTRLSPLVEPFIGSATIINRAFWVPNRVVMEFWTEFFEQIPVTIAPSSTPQFINEVPWTSPYFLVRLFTTHIKGDPSITDDAALLERTVQGAKADLSDPSTPGYNFTSKGKHFYNTLKSLGLVFNFDDPSNIHLNALPLLAYARIYYDAFGNSAYNNVDTLLGFFRGTSFGLTEAQLYQLLDTCYRMNYASDYFTSQFDQPNSPNVGTLPSFNVPDVNNGLLSVSGNNQFVVANKRPQGADILPNDPVIVQGSSATSVSNLNHISDYLLQTLHKVTDFVKRKQLPGSRPLDRYAADMGVELPAEKLRKSVMLGKSTVDIQISDVMQTAPNTSGGSSVSSGVGDYTGKGIGFGQNHICHLDTQEEYGYLIIVSCIVPKTRYCFGRPRWINHLSPMDFYHPEFDNLGTQATREDELVCGGMSLKPNPETFRDDFIFGFINRYAEFKVLQDNLTGDFLFDSKNTLLDGWIQMRDFRKDHYFKNYDTESPIWHTLGFTEAHGEEYNNVFVDRRSNFDHFVLNYHFDIKLRSPLKPLFDFYDFDSEGRELLMDINGSQA